MKNIRGKSILVLLLTSIMLYFILKDDFTNVAEIFKYTNITWLIVAILVYYFGSLIQTISLKLIIDQYKKDYSLFKAFRLNVVTNFFNGITPLASGGQPLQVYELHKDKIKVSDGTNIIVENFLIYQTSLITLSILCYIINAIFNIVAFNFTLSVLFFIGFILNFVVLIFAYVVGSSKTISKKIVLTIVKVLVKFKIVRDKTKIISKLENTCDEFYNGFKDMKKNKEIVIKGFFLQLIGTAITFTTTFFVFKALNLHIDMNMLECIVTSVFVFIAGAFVPIPGGTGGMEYTFFNFFESFLVGAPLKSSLLLWRFVTYLFPVVLGGLIFNIRKQERKEIFNNEKE